MILPPFDLTSFLLQIMHSHSVIHLDLNKRQDCPPLLPRKYQWEINIQDEQWIHPMACGLAGCQEEVCEFLGLF